MFSATIGIHEACARAAAGAQVTRAASARIPRPIVIASDHQMMGPASTQTIKARQRHAPNAAGLALAALHDV